MHHRIPRIVGALGLAIALAGGMLAAPAFAAKPAGAAGTANAIPPNVSPGSYAAFLLYFENTGPSNIAQLYLEATTPSNWTFEGVLPAPQDDLPAATSCNEAPQTDLFCSFGAVNDGDSFHLLAVYKTDGTASGTKNVTIRFHFNATGTIGGNSHGNDIAAPDGTVTVTDSKNVAGGFLFNQQAGTTIADSSDFHPHQNQQSTAVTAPAGDIGVYVSDGTTTDPGCTVGGTVTACPSTFIGENATVYVADGKTFDNAFEIVMTLYHSGYSASDVHGVYHSWTTTASDGTVTSHQELISLPSQQCADPSAPGPTPCAYAQDEPGNVLQIIVWTLHNGNFRNY